MTGGVTRSLGILLSSLISTNVYSEVSGRECLKLRMEKSYNTIKLNGYSILARLKGGSSGSMPPGQVIRCAYSHEWDNQGVFFLLGTMPPLPAPETWFNPAKIGRARIHCGNEGYIGISDIAQPEVQLDPAVVIDRRVHFDFLP